MMFLLCFFFFEWYGDRRDLHSVDRRQRQMCIRDSHELVGGEQAVAGVLPPDQGLDAHRSTRAERDAGPVSYTHLPAHETVLDLVRRLLLEKKKTINPSSVIFSPAFTRHSSPVRIFCA